jgi:GntR family transcriptional regulator, galactonate operon transcriptional repressor
MLTSCLGWMKKGFDHSLMEQLLVTRLIFEPNIAALAALHATDEDIIRLNDACNIMGQGQKLGKKYLFEKGDLAFHLALLDASHNAFMRSLGNALATAMSFSFKQTLEADVRLTKEAVHEHRELLVAVQNKDPQAARWRMRLILEHAAQKKPVAKLSADV